MCIGCSFLIGYHEEQRAAQLILHQKVGKPKEVLIQDFVPDHHMNMVREVRVLGEVNPTDSLLVNLGTDGDPRLVEVVPVYPVGADLMPIAVQERFHQNGERRRPIPRAQADDIGRTSRSLSSLGNHAFAFAISSANLTGENSVGRTVEHIADAGGRSLIRLSGAVVSGKSLLDTVSSSMLDKGIASTPDTLMVEPMLPLAEVSVTSEQTSTVRMVLTSLGILFAAVALLLPYIDMIPFGRKKAVTPSPEVKAAAAFPAVNLFQPIAAQDELAAEESLHGTGVAQGRIVMILKTVHCSIRTMMRIKNPQ